MVNAGNAFELRATATAQDSTYAGIVRLAEQAGAESAPIVRLADRYAAWFLPLTLVMAGAAWLASGSAVRAVAVLVVATPCPLLLAAPVAIVSGLSRASRQGVVIRSGGALENLGHATTLVMDKTGTLTMGRPVVVEILAAPGCDATEMLRLAASVDQMSPHVLAEAIVTEALTRGLQLSLPSDVIEEPGRGVTATIDDRRVQVGKLPPRRDRRGVGPRGGEPGESGLGRDRLGEHRRRASRCRVAARSVAPQCTPHGPAVARRRAEPVGHADRRPGRAGPRGRDGAGARRGLRPAEPGRQGRRSARANASVR